MPSKTIGDLPARDPLDGSELLPLEQGGNSRHASVNDLVGDKEPLGRLPSQNTLLGDYTLALADAGGLIEANSASLVTLTIPANADVAFPLKTVLQLHRYGSGDFAIAPAAGVSLISVSGNRKISAQYATATLYKRALNEWVLSGGLKA
jgi:hypothetical protein